MKEQKQKNKNKARKVIILKLKTHAFYLDKDGKLLKKGSFNKGRILNIDTKDFQLKNGKKLYRVINVSHNNIYMACTKKNCERLNIKHIKGLALGYLKKKKLTPAEIKKGLPKAFDILSKKIKDDLNKPASEQEGLSYYEDDSFNYDDGFCFNKDNASDLSFVKGGVEELYEDSEKPKKIKFNPLKKARGTGEGVGFEH